MSVANFLKLSTACGHSGAPKPAAALINRAEWHLTTLIAVTFFASVFFAFVRGQAVNWAEFFPNILVGVELVLVGVCVRRSRYLARTALGLIAVGLIICFLPFYAILTFTVLPFSNPMVDQQLLLADAAFGFNWVDAVNGLARYPAVASALWYIYFSIMPQTLILIAMLSFLKRDVEIYRFVAVGFLSMIMSVAVWWLIPSVGPAAYGMVSEAVQQQTHLIANAEYGERMWRYATEGNTLIDKSKLDGVIAFPSMHIVMTCMVVWFARRTWLFWPLLILNIGMPVATVLQGGHHIMDLFGGLVVFGVCLWASVRLVPKESGKSTFKRSADI